MKRNYLLSLLLVLLLALAGTGAAFDRGIYGGQPGGNYDRQGVGSQLAFQGSFFDAYILQAESTNPEVSPAGGAEDTLVSLEDGWQVVKSHTYEIRENRSFYNPDTQENENHEVGYNLNVSMESGKEFLIPADDADISGSSAYPRYRIFMGNGETPDWSISNVILPVGLDVTYQKEIRDPQVKYYDHEFHAEVQYEYVSVSRPAPRIIVHLFGNEMNRVTLQTRNKAGEESPERIINNVYGSNAHVVLGSDLFNANIIMQLFCSDEDEPRGWDYSYLTPKEGQDVRIFYYWYNANDGGLPYTITWDPAGWRSSDRDGDVTFTSGNGVQEVDLDWFRVPAPALYARVLQPSHRTSYLSKYFTYDDLKNFRGTINVQVVTPDGSPVPGMEVEFWGGQHLGSSSVKKQTDTNGEAEITYPPGTDGTDFTALTMTIFPKVDLFWELTQVVDRPAHIVRDHRAPLFISPFVYVNSGYLSSELSGVSIEVYDVNNPENVIAQNQPTSFRRGGHSQFGDYSDREVVVLGKHRAYIEIKPEELVSRRLGVRALVSDSDRGRRETRLTLGSVADPGTESWDQPYKPHNLFEPRRSFNFMFVPLRVGAWETGRISYSESELGQQEDYIRKIFPAPISFSKGLPYSVARGSGWIWGEESQRMYHRRIIRTLNRLQKMDRAAGTDLVVGMVPPGFLGAAGLQDPGAFHSNWDVLGASRFAVLIDPSQVRPHHTLHEFLHTLGLKDVYRSDEVLTDLRVGWRPLSANGHDGLPINNIERRISTLTYEYAITTFEAVMYDHALSPWVTAGEYSTLLNYAVQPSGGASGGWAELQAQTTPSEETGDMLLISGEALEPSWGKVQEIILDPVLPYKGAVDRGGDMADNPYVVQLVDAGGVVLEQGFFDHFEYEDTKVASFLLSLPRHENMAAIEIGTHHEGRLQSLWKRYDFTEVAPEATLTGPPAGTLSGEFEISWEAGHEDGVPLCSTLFYSADDGETWQTIAIDIPHDGPGAFSYTVNANELPAGEECRFKVGVSDRLHYAEAVSAASYVVEGYITSPSLELPQQEIIVRVTEETAGDAAATLSLSNAGSEELTVQFDAESMPGWVSPNLAQRKIRISRGANHVEVIELLLPSEKPETPLEAELVLETNDPENPTATVTLKVVYEEEPPAPELASFLTDPPSLPSGSWPVRTPVTITAYAGGARSGLNAAVTIEAVGGTVIAEEVPMDPNPHRAGAYLFSWNPAEAGAAAGEYGVSIHLEDPATGLERESEEYDFTFTLYEPNSAPVFSEPETYKNDLGTVKAGDTVVIPFLVDDPDGDDLQMEVSSPLTEHGLELIRHDNNSGELHWTANQIGEFEIILTAEDPAQAQAGAIFSITVEENLVFLDIRIWGGNGATPGTVTPAPWQHVVNAHVPITVKATPHRGYEFERWSIAPVENITVADMYAAETTVILTEDAVLRAVFTEAAGSQSLGELEIGDRVVDPSWEWEHKMGAYYSDKDRSGNPVPGGVKKPVTWIVAAKDHYNVEGDSPHITLIAEELIARHPFDDSTIRGEKYDFGSNHWGNSGKPDADYGLRPFLNSMNKNDYAYAGSGFYTAFSERFRSGVLRTAVPNIIWDTGDVYTTQDYVFAPSLTELGLESSNSSGTVLPYFEQSAGRQAKLQAYLPGFQDTNLQGIEYDWYWTRHPASASEYHVNVVSASGISQGTQPPGYSLGIRPVVNLSADMRVSLTVNSGGAYEISGGPGEGTVYYGDINGDGKVTVADAILVLRHIVGLINLETDYGPGTLERAKVSGGDGPPNVGDAILILRYIVGLITEFPT